ncbi:hypothetical protein [Marinomonas shanghaiensis]|jgi:hypothetical protein|uniref:hypothetical protein n=1 Tax=Marinomonas shanghaiensis TaxID=2202418 RepID=UPI000DB9097E|nr:hypothetical protein [Marinomonas shanghaiensis]
MFNMSHLITLSAALEQSVTDRDIDKIQQLCEDNNRFILTIEPLEDPAANEKIKHFIKVHQSAIRLIRDVRSEMQKQLYQTHKSRKGVNKYKGVKHAE